MRPKNTRLRRRVAVKVIRSDVASDPVRRARLQREATTAAMLNHPHVVTVHSLEEHAGVLFITMELIDGQTLANAAPPGGFPLKRLLPLAIQLADALSAAHALGLVHRDLKPANIMLTRDGAVKVLDFGVSRLSVTHDAAAVTGEALTQEGLLLGTAPYIAPEQIDGHPADPRSDLFSLGVVLFEMATGRRPFEGRTPLATLTSILNDTPPLASAVNPRVPDELARIINRCLLKDPARRMQSAIDLRGQLEDLARALETGTFTAQPVPSSGFPSRMSRLAGDIRVPRGRLLMAGLTLVAVTAAFTSLIDRTTARETLPGAPVMRLTSDRGLTTDPSISPDGKLVVYASDRAGGENLDLWVQQIDGGAPLRLTSDPADEYDPSFSPDGTQIVFRSDRGGGGVYVMPALGGEPRLIAKDGRQPRFSPDGSRIAFVIGTGSSQSGIAQGTLFVANSSGGSAQKLVSEDVGAASPVWAPDGSGFILFAAGKYRIDAWGLVDSAGGEHKVLALAPLQQAGLADLTPRAWLPGNRILFEAKSGDSAHLFEVGLAPPSWINRAWRLDATARPLTFGTAQDERPSVASVPLPDGGRRVAFASVSHTENIWSVALDTARPGSSGALTQLTYGSGSHIFPSVSADGTKLAFISHAAYNDEVSLLDITTGKRSVLSTTRSAKFKTNIRPDGSEVFYGDSATRSVYAVPASGGPPEPLCGGCDVWVWDWSPDRRHLLLFGPARPWVAATILDVQAKTSRVFLERRNEDVYDVTLSPDGRWVLFKTEAARRSHAYVAPFRENESPREDTWIPVTDGSALDTNVRWSPDGAWIYAVSDRDGFRCIWAYPLDPQTKRAAGPPVAVFHAHRARLSIGNANIVSQYLSVARNGIVFNQGEITGNIWMTQVRDDE
jgi:Tol biopolymer transport system component